MSRRRALYIILFRWNEGSRSRVRSLNAFSPFACGSPRTCLAARVSNGTIDRKRTRFARDTRGVSPSESPRGSEREYISRALSAVSKVYFGTLDATPVVEDVSDRFANGSAETPVAFRRDQETRPAPKKSVNGGGDLAPALREKKWA